MLRVLAFALAVVALITSTLSFSASQLATVNAWNHVDW